MERYLQTVRSHDLRRARELLQRALRDDTDYREFMGLCIEAHREVWLVGRCPDCLSPLGARHYCRRQGTVALEEVVRA